MSYPSQNTSLSLSTRLLTYLGPPSTILLTYIASPRTALFSPLAFLPTAWFYKRWQQSNNTDPSRRGELEPMIWTYAIAGTLGLTTSALVQLGILKATATLLLGSGKLSEDFSQEFWRASTNDLAADTLSRRAELAASWQNWVFNGVFTFIAGGLVEETIKYLPIIYARRRHHRDPAKNKEQHRNRAYIDYVLASALSFSVIEAISFLYAACEQGNEQDSWSKLALTLFERMVLGQIGHLSVAALTSLRAIRRDYYNVKDGTQLSSWWSVVGPSVLLHGANNFVAMAFSTLEGNVGWIHPTGVRNILAMGGLSISLVATAVWQVRQEWKVLDNYEQARRLSEEDDQMDKGK